jgi:hypothetical protein
VREQQADVGFVVNHVHLSPFRIAIAESTLVGSAKTLIDLSEYRTTATGSA